MVKKETKNGIISLLGAFLVVSILEKVLSSVEVFNQILIKTPLGFFQNITIGTVAYTIGFFVTFFLIRNKLSKKK